MAACQAGLCMGMEGLTTDSLCRDVKKPGHRLFVTFKDVQYLSFLSLGALKHVRDSGSRDDANTWAS